MLLFSTSVMASIAAQAADSKGFFPKSLNFSVPASAALDVLGVTPSKAKAPTSLQEVALGIVQGFDQGGRLKSGFAFNFPIFAVTRPNVSDFFDSRRRPFNFTNISLAAVRGSSDDPSARAAFSVSVPLIDRTDFRFDSDSQAKWKDAVVKAYDPLTIPTDFLEKNQDGRRVADAALVKIMEVERLTPVASRTVLTASVATLKVAVPEIPENLTVQELNVSGNDAWKRAVQAIKEAIEDGENWKTAIEGPGLDKKLADLKKEFESKNWNNFKLDFSAAYAFFAADGARDGLKGESTYLAASVSTPFTRYAQLTLVGRYGGRARSWNENAKAWRIADTMEYGVRARGGGPGGGAFIEWLYGDDDVRGGVRERRQLWQGGYEQRLGGGQWLQITLGEGSGLYSRTVFGVALSFNLSPTRAISNRGTVISGNEGS